MRKLLLASVAAAALSAPAFAADLPARSAPPAFTAPVPIAFSWTGFYAGLDAGYGWNESSWRNVGAPVFANFNTDGDGFVGGGHIGYNYQINQFVVGLEGMINFTDIRGSALCSGVVGTNCRTKQDWLADINVRAGFAIDRALIYATGGVAFTEYGFDQTVAPTVSWGNSSRTGWTIGVGLDYAITNNWIAGVQYKYYDFDSTTRNSSPAGTNVNFRNTENVILARISYKFGGPAGGAVVAKY
jgi:outer membrane immunogenic protein